MSTTNCSKSYKNPETSSGLKYGIIEVTTRCQFRCPGCYMVRRNTLGSKEMSLEQAINIIDLCKNYTGKELETMDILGGEPLLWKPLKDYIVVLQERGIQPWIFTNMVAITPDLAQWLFERQVSITGKLNVGNSHDPEQLSLQAQLVGASKEMAHKMFEAIQVFLEAGYKDPLFKLENLLRRPNLSLVPDYLRFCEQHEIGVDLEILAIGEGMTEEDSQLCLSALDIANLVKEVDANGLTKALFHEPSIADCFAMPHFSGPCRFNRFGLYFQVDGGIRACSNSSIQLSQIALDPEPIKKAFESKSMCARKELTQEKVQEPCHSCEKWEKCRGGCRATVEGMSNSFGGYELCPWPILRQEMRDR
ncbi:4Fe-4S cluster-binding domain-containing protein [Patescibacteria group bacterium]|nr:4Fe-4S cluster-binding domain-containing protein [Patescibacteria group bacterium]